MTLQVIWAIEIMFSMGKLKNVLLRLDAVSQKFNLMSAV